LVCLNTPKLGTDFLRDTLAAEAPMLEFIERVANPEVFADVDEERSLKVLVYRQPEQVAPSDSPAPPEAV
jgi:23S rRNA (cytosine1962-C5)-methyltransferase